MTPPPLKSEITPIDVAAEAARAGARASPLGAASIVAKWIARTWRGISDAEAESIVRDALDPTKTEATKAFLRKRYGEGAAASIFGRIRSGLQHNEPGMRVIRRGLVPLAGPDVTTPEQEDKKEVPASEESKTAPVSNKGMFDDLIPPEPPTAEDEARADEGAATSKVPAETVSFVSSLTPQQAKALAIVGEASKNVVEMRGVAHVLENRAQNPKRFGNSIYSILTDGEFDAFKVAPEELQKLMSSPRYARALRIVSNIEAGKDEDPTRGATHFLAPALMKQRGYTKPSWAKDGFMIGDTMFFNDVK
jgi:hypothetical protein